MAHVYCDRVGHSVVESFEDVSRLMYPHDDPIHPAEFVILRPVYGGRLALRTAAITSIREDA